MRGVDFDRYLLAKKGAVQYRLDKVKGGRCSSTAGCPRPYAKKNMQKARLFSPQLVGQKIMVTPKHQFHNLSAGRYYTWTVTEPGVGVIGGHGIIEMYDVTAEEIAEHFIVKKGANANSKGTYQET